LKPSKHHDKEKGRLSKNASAQKPSKDKIKKEGKDRLLDKTKKWREKDKKMLFERVKDKFLLFRKMRINIVRVDPFKKLRKSTKSQQRKRSKKRVNKK
jgi:hypothetical protein